jgi:hypothetical protein
MSIKRTNRNNRIRGKSYEKRVAASVGGVRNLDKSRPHTDVENSTHVYEVKSTQASVPVWLKKALGQLEQAATESKKEQGGVVKVYTKGSKARAFIIQEIELLQ